ncbi:MAG: hypothetical protein KC619_18540 [Myxococcales bacterium]|nr:hypothetical protein [Myxococcales bacterium]
MSARLGCFALLGVALAACTPTRLDLGENLDAGAAAPIVALAAGRHRTFAVRGDGRVFAFGTGAEGQLALAPDALPASCDVGAGAVACALVPVPTPTLDGADELALGLEHGCARRGGEVACWGLDLFGMRGVGATGDAPAPTPVAVAIDDAVSIAAGDWGTCAVHADGGVSCWGALLPAAVGRVAAELETCALDPSWALRFDLPFGGAATVPCATRPLRVPDLTSVARVALGRAHLCALRTDGSVVCLGSSELGQRGDGSTSGVSVSPVDAVDASVVAIDAGSAHTCVVQADEVHCWGDDRRGESGQQPAPTRCADGGGCVARPTLVAGFADLVVDRLAVGSHHACALSAGDAFCFGDAVGAGGAGETCELGPCRIPAVSTATGLAGPIAAGDAHTCAVTAAGGVVCWGSGAGGELGDGGGASSTSPVAVSF